MKVNVIAFHLDERIDLKKFRKDCSYSLLKREHTFLLYESKKEAYIYIKDYGSVVFFNCSDNIVNDTLELLTNENKDILLKESYNVVEGKKQEVDFDKIQVTEITLDVAHLIMLHLAQSVALSHYMNAASMLHETTIEYTKQLEKYGKINLSKKKMRIFIGRTMNLKNRISEDLFIFDSSDLAWSTGDLSKLDYQLKDELEIVKRHHGLQFNLNVIKENLELFKDILQHKYSSMLEWIIIILILFEVLQVIIEKI